MAKTPVSASRSRRSKTEVQEEFEEIRRKAVAEREAADTRTEQVAKLKEEAIHQAVEGVSVEGVVQSIAGLGVEVSKALGELSSKLVQEVDNLTTLREAVGLEKRELERLHQVDIVTTALGQLVQDFESRKRSLEAEAAEAQAAWASEVEARERAAKEYEEGLKKQRQREVEEYEYRKALERKKAQDKYDEDQRLRDKQNREKQEALEKSWKERDAALKAQEEELNRLRTDAEAFPKRLKQEVDKAVAEALRQAEQRFEQQITLGGKDAAADRRVAELQIKALEESAARQSEQLAKLQTQLEEAKRQVQEIAVKAIEGASGAKALAHVDQIAREQARTRPPQV